MLPRPALRFSLLALLVSSLAPATATAATVSVSQQKDAPIVLHYAAARGERNDVRITTGVASLSVSDVRAALTAGRGCSALDAHHLTCRGHRSDFGWELRVHLGDRADRAVFARAGHYSGGQVIAYGGPGGDVIDASRIHETGFLYGGEGRDRLVGTTADDVIHGDGSRDTLVGGRGADELRPDTNDARIADDVVDGGRGSDTIDYRGRRVGVTVDLRRKGHQGAKGENDQLIGIENVDGTPRDDVITGDDGENDLQGQAGRDTIRGLGGADRVWGTAGPDTVVGGEGDDIVIGTGGGTADGGPGDDQLEGTGTLLGGAGDDQLEAYGGATADCAEGNDTVLVTHHVGPVVKPTCEELGIGEDALGIALPVTRADDGLRAGISCDEEDGRIAICHDTFTVSLGEQQIASARYSISGGSKTLKLPYASGGKEALGAATRQVHVGIGPYQLELTV